jgi:predicted TIM-barrel fold metal-dependent hydrolase
MGTPVVDTHLHLWDLAQPGLDYAWLEVDPDPTLGALGELKREPWDSARFLRDTKAVDLLAAVHIQAAGVPGDPLAETEWLLGQQAETGVPQAIVGRAEMLADDVEDQIDRQLAATDTFRGVRDMTLPGSFEDPRLERALAALEARGLSWDLHCFHDEMGTASDLARRHPELPIALGHVGFPLERTDAYFADWQAGIATLAEAENVLCKVSGLGMADHDWTVDSWRPWFDHVLECFGPERCMFGSNWPVESLHASYDAIVAAFEELTADLDPTQRHHFFVGNAARHYRLHLKENA